MTEAARMVDAAQADPELSGALSFDSSGVYVPTTVEGFGILWDFGSQTDARVGIYFIFL